MLSSLDEGKRISRRNVKQKMYILTPKKKHFGWRDGRRHRGSSVFVTFVTSLWGRQ